MAQSRYLWLCLAIDIIGMVYGDRYYADFGDYRGYSTRRRVVSRVVYRRRTRPAYGRERVVLVNSGQLAGGANTVYVPVSQVVGAVGVPPAVVQPSISGVTSYHPLVPS